MIKQEIHSLKALIACQTVEDLLTFNGDPEEIRILAKKTIQKEVRKGLLICAFAIMLCNLFLDSAVIRLVLVFIFIALAFMAFKLEATLIQAFEEKIEAMKTK